MKRYHTGKLAAATFIASEAVFFGFLIIAYIYYSTSPAHGPTARASLDPARTLIFTICLFASSGTLWFAERRFAANQRTSFRIWLGATILLGAIFLAGQGMEYAGLLRKSITPERNLFGATFFTLTGFHGFHVLCGLLALIVVLVVRTPPSVGAVAIYWHFVDFVWLVIFSLVYVAVWV